MTNLPNAQFVVPQVTPEQEKEILFNHVIAYCTSGISYAKSKGTSAKEYGEYMGNLFKPFWNSDEGFPALAIGLMYILNGMYPDNEMQILEQSDKMLRFKLKNVDIAFQQGPVYGVAFEELVECSEGQLETIGEHMGTNFSHKISGIWYEVELQAK